MMPIVSFHTYPLTNIPIYPFGSVAVIGWAGIIAYAILKHRLMDIDIVIKKSVTYSALLALLLVPCYALIIYAQDRIFGRVEPRFTTLALVLLTLAAFVFPRLKPRTEQTIEQVLFKGRYDYRDTLEKFSQDLVTILQLDTLLTGLLRTLVNVMGISRATAFLADDARHCYVVKASHGKSVESSSELALAIDDPLIETLSVRSRFLVTEELERMDTDPRSKLVAQSLRRLECEACIPLTTKNQLIGIVTLGRKIDRGIFNTEEIRLLAMLGNQAAIAVENARLYDNLKRQKTRMQRAERLATLGTLTAGLAHEIRNPLVSVKTFLQLLPDRMNDLEFRTTFLDITLSEVERISRLLSQLLDFARPSELNLNLEDLAEMLETMALLAEAEAAKRGIVVKRHYEPGLPKVMFDLEQIKQVLQNILNNAIQATPDEGAIQIDVRPVHGAGGVQQAQIEICDTGKGIPEEDLEKIFMPFFTTKETGTGLGLAVAHRVIEEHGGTIEVTSQVGRGTSFIITLPLDPDTLSLKTE